MAQATAEGVRLIAEIIRQPGGQQAVDLRIAEQYINEFGNLAKTNNTMIIPSNLSDVAGLVASLKGVVRELPGTE